MATPIYVNVPHPLGRAEARRRIELGFVDISRQFPGSGGVCTEVWDGDRLNFNVVALGQTISGFVHVHDTAVAMQIELPGVLGVIASGLEGRLESAAYLLLEKE